MRVSEPMLREAKYCPESENAAWATLAAPSRKTRICPSGTPLSQLMSSVSNDPWCKSPMLPKSTREPSGESVKFVASSRKCPMIRRVSVSSLPSGPQATTHWPFVATTLPSADTASVPPRRANPKEYVVRPSGMLTPGMIRCVMLSWLYSSRSS
eukprot:6741941-Prymnesium_polylepis.1